MEKIIAKRPHIAFIIQRCGLAVNGGAESLCLQIAQHMAEKIWQVEILTTCAINYYNWANYYTPGDDRIGDVIIRRFPVAEERKIDFFNKLSETLVNRFADATKSEQEIWMRAQGPFSPALSDYIESHRNNFDAFFFFTYLYASTYFPLQNVASKAILVPLAHKEWTISLPIWDQFFRLPRAFVFNSIEERDLLRHRFTKISITGPIAGIVVEPPGKVDPERFRKNHGIDKKYILYIGRIDPSKGCEELLTFFLKYRATEIKPLKLVLLGKPEMKIPNHPDILPLGFVSEQEKWDALAACELLVMPSRHESLSIVLLEAWRSKKPVLVSGQCDVLVGQCKRANGGIWYKDFDEFSTRLRFFQNISILNQLGLQGFQFVSECYSWPTIENAYIESFKKIVVDK